MQQYIDNIQKFADKFGLKFEQQGECGFGRECVGLLNPDNNCYIDYNPIRMSDYEYLPDFYDERLSEITPPDAYHKHRCIAVLGRGEEAIKQLSEWVDKLNKLGVTVEKYVTGAVGVQAMISGSYGASIKVIQTAMTV